MGISSKKVVRRRTMRKMKMLAEKQCSHQDQQEMVGRLKMELRKKKTKRRMMKRTRMMSLKTIQMK